MRDPVLTDEVMITKKSACIVFNMSRLKFDQRWENYYRYKIRHVNTSNGVRIALIDVMRAAYPSASEQTAHMMALDFTCRLKDGRNRRRNGAKNKDEGEES